MPGEVPGEVRVLVVDDDPVVRDALRAFLDGRPGLSLCGEAGDGDEGVRAYAALRPDVVLMDLQMPRLSGVEAIASIHAEWPDACLVALTTFGTSEFVTAALRAGAAGYLLKDADAETLERAIREALAGEMPLSPAVRRELAASLAQEPVRGPAVDRRLTPRESELLGWLASGLTNQQIGARMYISEGSVKQYLSHVGEKLGARSRTQILVTAIRERLVDLDVLPLD